MILLLVDDEFHVRKKLLHKIDWEALGIDTLLEAEDGESGYETAKRRKIDILISDIRMPRMDGIEMAGKIRELYPDCVILFLSGYSDKEYLRSAISLHALSYIDKPVSPEQVVSAVREAVDYCNNMQNSTVFAAKIKEARLVRLLCSPRPGEEQLTSLLKDCGLSPLSFQTPAPCCCRAFPPTAYRPGSWNMRTSFSPKAACGILWGIITITSWSSICCPARNSWFLTSPAPSCALSCKGFPIC